MEQFPSTNMPEEEQHMNEISSNLIAGTEHGLGYGSGGISRNELEEATEQKLAQLDQLLASGEVLVPVSVDADGKTIDDDGCGDGRPVAAVHIKEQEEIVRKSESLNRPKVFGGGPAMAGAALVATGDQTPDTAAEILQSGLSALKLNMIDFGAHTDDHAEAPKSGCGAIDNCPAIMQNAVVYRDDIKATIIALGVPAEGLDGVLDRFKETSDEIAGKDYAGSNVMEEIIDSGKVVKELAGEHKEVAVVLNDVQGYTVDQEKVRQASEGLQTFAVDVWRLQDLSARLYPGNEQKQLAALQGMLVYTLATAATLTKGDLPIYRISPKESLVSA